MNPEEHYRILTAGVDARYRHLGSLELGFRTACGKLLDARTTMWEQPGSVDFGCLACRKTTMYKLAVASGQLNG